MAHDQAVEHPPFSSYRDHYRDSSHTYSWMDEFCSHIIFVTYMEPEYYDGKTCIKGTKIL